LALCTAQVLDAVDSTVVNVALPAIQDDLAFTAADLSWVVNSYTIAFGGLLLLAGRLGDLAGRRRVLVGGLALFTAASLLCGLATSPGFLIGARFVQGVGGALASAVTLGMIVVLFPEPREQARAIGVFSFVGAAGASIGVLAGGLIVDALSWQWIFFVNVPIGLVATVLSVRLIAADRGIGLRAGADGLGAALVTAGLMLAVYAVVGAAESGWLSVRTLGLGALAIVLLGGFVVRQTRAAHPLLPLRLFRSRRLSGANLVMGLAVAGMFAFQFVLALYVQRVLGYGAARTGVAFLPISVMIGMVSLGLSPRLNNRFGPHRVLLAGTVLLAAGLALLTRLGTDAGYAAEILPVALLLGCGAGMMLPAVTTLAMVDVPPADAGVASGLVNTSQQVGGALGVAVLTTLASWRAEELTADGAATAEALTAGYHLAWAGGAVLMAAAAVLTAVVLRPAGHRERITRPPIQEQQIHYSE